MPDQKQDIPPRALHRPGTLRAPPPSSGSNIGRDLTERVAAAAFLADRRPQALPVALAGIGDVARCMILLPGESARPIRDAGECLAALLGSARHAHERLNAPALVATLTEMGRVAARVAALEMLIPVLPPNVIRVVPGSSFRMQDQPPQRGGAALRTFHRLIRREGRPASQVSFTLLQGGRL